MFSRAVVVVVTINQRDRVRGTLTFEWAVSVTAQNRAKTLLDCPVWHFFNVKDSFLFI